MDRLAEQAFGHPDHFEGRGTGQDGYPELLLPPGYAGAGLPQCPGADLEDRIPAFQVIGRFFQDTETRRAGQHVVLTGEDLCNLGPVALLRDLALMSLLGIEHVERNGHHYYRGLSLWPEDWQTTLLAVHGDLYTRPAQGFTCLEVRAGRRALGSVNAAPFGLQPLLDAASFPRQTMP